MITLKIILTILIVGYTAFIMCKFKIPKSYSDSFYLLNEIKKDLGYVFTIWCFAVSILAIILMTEASNLWILEFLSFVATGALALVGAAPAFKVNMDSNVHPIAAIVCAVAALAWITIQGFILVPVVIVMLLMFLPIKIRKKIVFWGEFVMFLSLLISLYFI